MPIGEHNQACPVRCHSAWFKTAMRSLRMGKRAKRRDYLDAAIVAARRRHEEAEPDNSTERLFAIVETDTGAGVGRQIEALHRTLLIGRHPPGGPRSRRCDGLCAGRGDRSSDSGDIFIGRLQGRRR